MQTKRQASVEQSANNFVQSQIVDNQLEKELDDLVVNSPELRNTEAISTRKTIDRNTEEKLVSRDSNELVSFRQRCKDDKYLVDKDGEAGNDGNEIEVLKMIQRASSSSLIKRERASKTGKGSGVSSSIGSNQSFTFRENANTTAK